MRHKKALGKLGRNPAHRHALLRNMATSLILHDQIETTLPRAKELKRVADKLITLGKTDTLHNRRQAMSYLRPVNRHATGNAQKWTAVHKLFSELAPRFDERQGGYTRVVRTRKRDGDKAQMAIIQFVEATVEKKTEKRRQRRTMKAPEPQQEAVESNVES
ncbi:MAG: 50S ribosomal protein L17 [Bdellovibrionales bacterium]|nr:50S ribosomal protein L17 [Bdellovibrionales bacterium]